MTSSIIAPSVGSGAGDVTVSQTTRLVAGETTSARDERTKTNVRALAVFEAENDYCNRPRHSKLASLGRDLDSALQAELYRLRHSESNSISCDTSRVTPHDLTPQMRRFRAESESFDYLSTELLAREAAAEEASKDSGMPIFIGGRICELDGLNPAVIEGILHALVVHLNKTKYQFASLNLAVINHETLAACAEAIRTMGLGGARFAVTFSQFLNGSAFLPAANNPTPWQAGVGACMGNPGILYRAAESRENLSDRAEAVAHAHSATLQRAEQLTRAVAKTLGVAYQGIDPSQACENLARSAPRTKSMGAVIESFSGVPLGCAGTKNLSLNSIKGWQLLHFFLPSCHRSV